MEYARTALAITFLAVALYSLARLTWFAAPRGTHSASRVLSDGRVSDITHALMGFAMAAMILSPDAVPALPGLLVFGALAVWLVAIMRHDGVMSRAGADAEGRHGGYHLHHLAGCVAMIYMFAAGHGGEPEAATSYSAATASTLTAHHELAPLTSISWLLGLYFLVAATSLGFRVAEPTGSVVRVRHHPLVPAATAPAGPGASYYPAPVPRPALTRALSSTAGLCAGEVVMSGGMAFMFFTTL